MPNPLYEATYCRCAATELTKVDRTNATAAMEGKPDTLRAAMTVMLAICTSKCSLVVGVSLSWTGSSDDETSPSLDQGQSFPVKLVARGGAL